MKSIAALSTIALVFVFAAAGWVMNIVSLVSSDTFAGMEIARAIGIFVAPLGVVLGYF